MTSDLALAAPTGRRRDILTMSDSDFNRIGILARMYAASSFNATGKTKEGDYFLIMVKGYEVGFSLTAAVDFIKIVFGNPCISAAGMLALIHASDDVEDVNIQGDEQKCTVTMKRKGREPHSETFTMEMARKMGLDGKDQWRKMPALMLKWRAVSFCARAYCPDIIGGMYTVEEMRDVKEDQADEPQAHLSAPQRPALPAPSHDDQPAPEQTKPWYQTGALQTLVERARNAGYIEQGQGANDLLALLGNGATWSKFAGAGEAGTAIKAAVEALKGSAPNNAAPQNAPAPAPQKPAAAGKAELTDISTANVEWATYDGQRIVFRADGAGDNGVARVISCWSRDEFAQMVGEAFAAEWGVRDWHGTKEKVERYDCPVSITYGKNQKGYWTLISATPASPLDDPFADLMDADDNLPL